MRFLARLAIATSWIAVAQAQSTVFERAVMALNEGDYKSAEAGFREVLAGSPQHIGAMQDLGLVYSRTNRLDQAVALYLQALTVRPSDAGLLRNLGLAYLKKDSYKEALPVFQKLVDANPQDAIARDPGLLYLLTIGYLKQNPTTEGRTAVGTLLNSVPPAPASFVLCKIYFETGRFDEAADQCRKTLAADSGFPGAHRELGKALVSLHSAGAEKELDVAVAEDANDGVAAYYLGVAMLQDSKVEEASSQLEKAIRLDPGFWGSYYYLGKVKLQTQRWEQAVPLLRKAVALNAGAAVAFYELGRALNATGQTAEAELAMQRVRELRAEELQQDTKALRKQ
jgi:tetratricopeptide (TPR) repeat protein